tara:strand:+ start:107 stop:1540 length:1434 start_codon:yes stop_codon:yes gene_type:complete
MSTNVYSMIEAAASTRGDDVAIVDDSGALTYAQLHTEVEALKATLEDNGLDSGQGLGVMMRNSRAFIVGVFAGLGCGASVMPLSHQLKGAELDAMLADVTIHAVLDDLNGPTPSGEETRMVAIGEQPLRLTRTVRDRATSMAPGCDVAFVRFTSGTTGESKGVAVSHRAVLERTAAAQAGLSLGRQDTVIWVLPMAYHFIVSIVLYLRYGARIAICRDVLAQTMIACINENRGTMLYAAPMHYRLLAADKSNVKTPTLQRAISTSSAIALPIAEAYQKRFGLPVIQAYGIIEIGLPIINLAAAESHPGAIGHGLPDYRIGILDESGECLPADSRGQLAVQGPGMFDMYLCPPAARETVTENGWFLTGDLATMTAAGLITVVGRVKSMINVSGNKVFPEEVERVLDTHPAIAASRVSGIEHPIMGETVQAELVIRDDHSIETEQVLKYCRERLSSYKVPQFLHVVSEIPLTGSGKVAR